TVGKTVGCRFKIILGYAGRNSSGGGDDLAVSSYGIVAINAGGVTGGAEAEVVDPDLVGSYHDGDHGTCRLVFGIAEGLANCDHRSRDVDAVTLGVGCCSRGDCSICAGGGDAGVDDMIGIGN